MKISNSKKELARIISENGGWSDGAEWAAQDSCGTLNSYQRKPVYSSGCTGFGHGGGYFHKICAATKIKNWHQAILSRAEYFHLYPAMGDDGWIEWNGGECPVDVGTIVDVKHRDGDIGIRCHAGMSSSEPDGEGHATAEDWSHLDEGGDIIAYRLHKSERANPKSCKPVTRSIPEVEAKPTIEQLAADYRNLLDFARRKQQEADAAKDDADAKLAELVAAGKAIGLALGVEVAEPELVITDFRDLRAGDEISVQHMKNVYSKSEVLVVGNSEVSVRNHAGARKTVNLDVVDWKFIRRP